MNVKNTVIKCLKKGSLSGFPVLVTLFSAPNYAAHYNNKGAVICYNENSLTIKQYSDSPQPYNLPNYQNVFAWSIPFVVGKINELMVTLLNLINDAQADEEEKEKAELASKMKKKLLAMAKISHVFAEMKQENQKQLLLSGLISSSGETPAILVGKSNEEIKEIVNSEEGVKAIDAENEMKPHLPSSLTDTPKDASRSNIKNYKRLTSTDSCLEGTTTWSPETSRRGNSDSPTRTKGSIPSIIFQQTL